MFFLLMIGQCANLNLSKTIYRYVFKKFRNIAANITEIAIV